MNTKTNPSNLWQVLSAKVPGVRPTALAVRDTSQHPLIVRSTSRICICCGEPLAAGGGALSRNPNVCASCSSMADGLQEPAADWIPVPIRHDELTTWGGTDEMVP